MFPFRSKAKELQKTIATLEGIIADNRHVAWKTIRENEEQFKFIKQEQAMNETVEMSKLRGEISILKEELQRIKIVAEQEKNRANWNYEQYNDLQQELEKTKEQRDELDREITCLHTKYFRQRVEKEREHLPGAPAHCKEKTGIDAILAEREKTHGSFETHANCTSNLEELFYSFKGKAFYSPVMQEGLHMIFHKLGRIAAGYAMHKDHWDDIAGYSTLVSRDLSAKEKE